MEAKEHMASMEKLIATAKAESVGKCKLIVRDKKLMIVPYPKAPDTDILIAVLSEKDIREGLRSMRWDFIECKIMELIGEDKL